MSSYKYILENYHAVRHADLSLDGVTVIAGINGCGKSTISKWLYALINFSNKFNGIVAHNLLGIYTSQLRKLARIINSAIDDNLQNGSFPFRRFIALDFRKDNSDFDDDSLFDDLCENYKRKIEVCCDFIERILAERPDILQWLKKSILEDNLFSSGNFIKDFYQLQCEFADVEKEKALSIKNDKKISDLFKIIRSHLDFYEEPPLNFSLIENGLNLFDKNRFIVPITLERAVYIDSPMFLSSADSDNKIWENLKVCLSKPLKPYPENAIEIIIRIRQIIGGNVIEKEKDFSKETELRYIRKEDNLNIPLNDAATGLKSFAYLLKLIENGYLDSNALLIIDEPEAHLHPQWIVEFARILILINKLLGSKILIASHNPDMVAALGEIAKAERLENTTNFYLAVRNGLSLQYDYVNLENNTEEIFSSFNIAFDKIKDYCSHNDLDLSRNN